MQFTVLIHHSDQTGYWAEVPTLSGCYSHGDTLDEALENVKEAIEHHVTACLAVGKELPDAGGGDSSVEVRAAYDPDEVVIGLA